MAAVKVEKPEDGLAWGALYWQYFEELDKITFAETPLSLKKALFLETQTSKGPELTPIEDEASLKPGDKVVVRIELRVDRDMEYVHMKDMRAAGFEPMNVLSTYKYRAGLGFYESTRDAATHFFFDYLPKGTHVFEYPLACNPLRRLCQWYHKHSVYVCSRIYQSFGRNSGPNRLGCVLENKIR